MAIVYSSRKLQPKGFTMVEILITIGMAGILMGLATINLMRTERTTSVATVTETFMADAKSQQVKAMNGATALPSSGESYGIHIDSDKYTLFHGTTYDPSNHTTNFIIPMDNNIILSTTFHDRNIVFDQLSGEITTFSSSAKTDSVTFTSGTGNVQKKIIFNQYGVVTDIQ